MLTPVHFSQRYSLTLKLPHLIAPLLSISEQRCEASTRRLSLTCVTGACSRSHLSCSYSQARIRRDPCPVPSTCVLIFLWLSAPGLPQCGDAAGSWLELSPAAGSSCPSPSDLSMLLRLPACLHTLAPLPLISGDKQWRRFSKVGFWCALYGSPWAGWGHPSAC